MIGSLADATQAVADYASGAYDNVFSHDGSSRIVYLINDVIYKINRADSYDANGYEFDQWNKLMTTGALPPGVVIPEMFMYYVNDESVIACEYVTGDPTGTCSDEYVGLPCSDDGECMDPVILADLGWFDDCWGNAIRQADGTICLVDLA